MGDQINDAFANKLSIVICIWGMNTWSTDVSKGKSDLAERWGQLARLWKNYSSDLVFEIMNEPAGIGFQGDAGNANAMMLYDAALQAIRNEDPTRPVLIGPPGYNDAVFLDPYVTKAHLKYTFDGGKGFYEDQKVGAAMHFYTPRGENGVNWEMWTQPLGTNESWGKASKWQGPITDQIMYAVNWRKSIGHDIPVVATEWGCWLFPARDESPDLPAWLDFTVNSLKTNDIGSMWYTGIMNNQRVFGIFDSETGWNPAVLSKLTGVHPTTWPSINQVVNGEFLPGDQAWQLTTKTITKEIITSRAYSGNSMLKLTVPAGSGGQLYTQTYSGTDDKGPGRTLLHLIQGKSYKIKFVVGTDAGQQGRLQVSLRAASDGSLIEEFKAIDVSVGPTTSVISYKHQAANAVDVRLQFDVISMKQVLYLDKVEILSNTDESLASGREAARYMAAPAPTPTPPSGNAFLPVTNATLALAAVANQSILPPETLSHFAVITGWDKYDSTLALYTKLLGPMHPTITAGGELSNGTYLGKRMYGKCKLSFTQINDKFALEVLAGDDKPSWWRDIYAEKGIEVHHMGYMMKDEVVWSVVKRFEAAGLGKAVSWARFIEDGKPPSPKTGGPGCFVYMDAQKTLGVTVEILGRGDLCDGLPDPPEEDDALVAVV